MNDKKTLVISSHPSAALTAALSAESHADIVLLEEENSSTEPKSFSEKELDDFFLGLATKSEDDPSSIILENFTEDDMEDFSLFVSDEKPKKNTSFYQKHPKSKFKNPRPR